MSGMYYMGVQVRPMTCRNPNITAVYCRGCCAAGARPQPLAELERRDPGRFPARPDLHAAALPVYCATTPQPRP